MSALSFASVAIVLVATILAVTAPLLHAKQFISAPQYPTGLEPYLPVVADFNLDGKPDVVMLRNFAFSVLLGNGDSSFQPPLEFDGVTTGDAVAGDLNLDGKPDLAITDGNGGVIQIYLGRGDGTFGQPISTTVDHPAQVAIGDLNRDGKPDLVTTVWSVFDGTRAVNVLLGKGDGHFQPAVEYPVGGRPDWVQVADINADGRTDVVAVGRGVSEQGTISVLFGNGDGTLAAAIDSGVRSRPYTAALADLNGDGKLDVAVVNQDQNSLGIAFGNGDGTFQSLVLTDTGAAPRGVVAADFNNDGKMDLATSNLLSNTVCIRLGNGDGTFKPRLNYGAGDYPEILAAGDFNRDGKIDLVVPDSIPGSRGKTMSVLLGNGDGTLQASRAYALGDAATSLAAGDFNSDGRPDLVVALSSFQNAVSVLLSNANGTFSIPHAFPVPSTPQEVNVGDFNGDGKLDIVAACDYPPKVGVAVLLGNGDGTFQPHLDLGLPLYLYRMIPADFNKDGKLDVAFLGLSSEVGVLLGNGDGTFTSSVLYRMGGSRGQLATGDVNGDGKPDLVVGEGNLVSVLRGNGDGTFQPKVDSAIANGITGIALADFNEDGKLDAVVMFGPRVKGHAEVILGNGDGTFQTGTVYPAGLEPSFTTVADFNKDGHIDVAVVSDYSSTLSVFLGNGDGTLRQFQEYATGSRPLELVQADFNGDGYPDLATANLGVGFGFEDSASVLLNAGAGGAKQ
jgi:hypothetical protein